MLRKIVIGIVLGTIFYLPVGVLAAQVKAGGMPPVFVETVTVKNISKPEEISATGNLLSIPGIIVKPEIGGRITKIYFKSGDFVEKDAPLFEINPDAIQAELVATQAELKVNKLNFERSFALYKTKDISKSDFDQAQAKYNASKAKVDGAQAKLRQAAVTAPFAGKLGLNQVSEGDYVTVGQSIVSLQTVNPLKVDFSIPEIYQNKVKVAQTVILRTDAYPEEIFKGKVEAVEALINQNNRTLGVRADVPNDSGKLIPGGFVSVNLQFPERQVVTIPQTSIVYEQDGSYVYKVIGDKTEKVKVVLGEKDSKNVEIKSGISIGDVIVTAGQIKIYPGAHVIIADKQNSPT